ncbi:hypothetical protein ACFOHK_03720 [Falsigemmobacter intermedius]|uniref:OmpH family outer membrane protein n=1 Tax=Falsigemmobacter intermedius TaxID=1553448 RepID=A0A451GH06_9RHOB|nr:OmpH family outer membrane protein [Falsigemmobacter intermedius]RWY37327.1 OmpH family outer membrane protein [Falsigemmobacter intermedius]
MSDKLFIGYCEYEPRNHTRIICEAVAKNGSWQNAEMELLLPPLGKVFAPSLPLARKGQYLSFTAKPNPRSVDAEHDKFIVDQHLTPREVIDMRGLSLEQIRFKVLTTGFDDLPCGTEELILALSPTECVPVRLAPDVLTNRFVAQPGTFKIHVFDGRLFEGKRLNGRWRELPGETVGIEINRINWLDDRSLLEELLKKFRKSSSGPSRREEANIIRQLVAMEAFLKETWADNEWLDWTTGFIGRIQDHMMTIPLIAEHLLETPEVRAQVESSVIARTKELEEGMRVEIRAALFSEMSDLEIRKATLEKELVEAEAGLVARRAEIAGLLAEEEALLELCRREADELRDQQATLRSQIAEEIVALGGALDDASMEHDETFDAMLDRFRSVVGADAAPLITTDPTLPPWIAPRRCSAEPLSVEAFAKKLRRTANEIGISEDDFEYFDLALRSGACAVLPTQAAERMMPGYAQLVSGGEIFREVIGPGTIALDDLWTRPGNGEPGGLRLAWTAARRTPERYHLLWLDGLDMAPMKLWLPSLLDILRGPERPRNLLIGISLSARPADPSMTWSELPRSALCLAPALRLAAGGSLLREASGRARPLYYLPHAPYDLLEKDALEDRILANEIGTPMELTFEIGLHRAACLFGVSDETISTRVTRLIGLRRAGETWLNGLLKEQENA